MTWDKEVKKIKEREKLSLAQGGSESVKTQHKKGRKKELKVIVEYEGPIKAPIDKNQEIGLLKIFYKDELIGEHKIFSTKDVKKVNLFSRIAKSVNYLIWGDV